MSKTEDHLNSYFREATKFRLLTREEEVELARRAEEGDREARKKLVNSNLKLVISIANKYKHNGLPFPDLIQAGNMGLLKAVDKFDWRKDCKFSTYAYWWIRQAVLRSLSREKRNVRLPYKLIQLQWRIRKEERGKKLSLKELAERLGETAGRIKRAKRTDGETSLDGPLNVDQERTLLNLIGDEKEGPEGEALKDIRREKLEEVMSEELTERERRILKLRFGLGDGNPRILEEIGEVFDLSRERIRQLKDRALDKLEARKEELKFFPALNKGR